MREFFQEITEILKACESKKAYNFSLIDITKLSSLFDYFVICSGNNEKQTVAIADEIVNKMSKNNVTLHHVEGYKNGRWIVLDYGYVVIHIFHKDERQFYNLESLWSDGIDIDVEQFGIENWK